MQLLPVGAEGAEGDAGAELAGDPGGGDLRAGGKVEVLVLDDLLGGSGGGGHREVDLADLEEHEGAVLGGEVAERMEGELAGEVVHAS